MKEWGCMGITEAKNIMAEMTALCQTHGIERDVAVRALRALCRHFGGQQVFIPRYKREGSETGDTVRGVIDDAVGDADGDRIADIIMQFFGGVPIYVPFEARAFRSEVAAEIKERYDGTQEMMRDLCREFHISFTHFYRLWHKAQKDRVQQMLPGLF